MSRRSAGGWCRPTAADEPWEVVGVVADVRYGALTITESQAEAYLPLQQIEQATMLGGMFSSSSVAVRTAGDPLAAVPFLRETVVLPLQTPIWPVKVNMARCVRQRISAVLEWALR